MSQALTAFFVFLKCQTVSSINKFLQVSHALIFNNGSEIHDVMKHLSTAVFRKYNFNRRKNCNWSGLFLTAVRFRGNKK